MVRAPPARQLVRIGLNLPQYAVDFDDGACSFERVVSLARRAEAAGLDSVWISDHPFVIAPDGSVCGALAADALIAPLLRATSRVRVGTLALAATMRAPEMVAALARSCGEPQRLVAGVGTGWYEPEHRAYGIPLPPFGERVERLWATLRALGALPQRPAILAGGVSDAVLDCAAAGADVWNAAWDAPPGAYAALARRADAACDRAGRDPATLARSIGVTVAIGPTRADLEAAVERVRKRAPYLRGLSLAALEARIVAGPPERVAERLAEYRAAGASEAVVTLLVRDDAEAADGLGLVVQSLRATGR